LDGDRNSARRGVATGPSAEHPSAQTGVPDSEFVFAQNLTPAASLRQLQLVRAKLAFVQSHLMRLSRYDWN
jgi:hypothetical protein